MRKRGREASGRGTEPSLLPGARGGQCGCGPSEQQGRAAQQASVWRSDAEWTEQGMHVPSKDVQLYSKENDKTLKNFRQESKMN